MSYLNVNSPEYFVQWTRKRFFQNKPIDFKKPEVLNAVKSWVSVGNEHYSSYRPWIALRTYMFIFCYKSGFDIIEDCLDLDLALEILGGSDGSILRNPSRINLKNEFVENFDAWMKEPKTDEQVEGFLVHHFACYTVLLNQIKQLENSL